MIEDTDSTNLLTLLLNLPDHIITDDINAHAPPCTPPLTDHRGTLIENILLNSNHIVLNQDTPTKTPPHLNQRSTSLDITTTTNNLFQHTT